MLHYTNQREKWFAIRDERMRWFVERWMKDKGIVYKDGLFTCDNGNVFECFGEDDEEEEKDD